MSISDRVGRALRAVRAPQGFADCVLVQAGLADRYAPIESPLGKVFAAYNSRGISYVTQAKNAKAFEREFVGRFGRKVLAAPGVPARLFKKFDLAHLSSFQRAVLLKTMQIPPGEVRPYGWIAAQIGSPKAVRAVGTALARNPVPLLIPCHRVVRGDGMIGDYALGSANKRRILQSEGLRFQKAGPGWRIAAGT
ncbi:MAG: methylated-DNA--[protein]-cysteine S-methyltransferase [Candidatus Baltobacteraceae bacterium]